MIPASTTGVSIASAKRACLATSASSGPNAVNRRLYIFDTGVRDSHREFERFFGLTRVEHLFNATGEPDGDHIGHGTHVAGIAAGRTFGVAKWAEIFSVQLVDSNINAELDWLMDGFLAIKNHMTSEPTHGIAIMSWSGGNVSSWVTGQGKQEQLLRQRLGELLGAHSNLLRFGEFRSRREDLAISF